MLTVKILSTTGESAPRDELATLYASDLSYNPFPRRNKVSTEGIIEIPYPGEPVILHAKLTIPGYGYMWVLADNGGQGYKDNLSLDFTLEAAKCRIEAALQLLAKNDFSPSVKCLSLLADAKVLAGASPEANMVALANSLYAGELASVERARAVIAKNPKRDAFLFGCGGFAYPYASIPGMKERYNSIFNFATLPFYLARLEQEKGKPNYDNLDMLQDEFEKNGITTKAHPLWWGHDAGMPPWTEALKWDDGSIQRELRRVCMRSVERYKGRIQYYDVINEAHDWCNRFMLTQEQNVEMTKLCCDAVHEADQTANAIVNTCFMFGENVADERVQWGLPAERLMTPYTYLQRLEALGTQYETIGVQLYCPNRDMLEIDKLYDRFAAFNKPLHLTELGVPSRKKDIPLDSDEGAVYCLRFMYSGLWREMGWSERLQADWVEEFYTISYARKEVDALTWWSFTDHSYIPAAGLTYKDGTPKEAFFRLNELQKSWGF